MKVEPFHSLANGESMKIESPVFKDGALIPSRFTCDSDDIFPPFSWSGVPEKTRSLALICDDPDAPVGTWVHWVLFNLLPDVKSLPEHVPATPTLNNGAKQGKNDFRNFGYGGPCPPGGTHRYFFTLYALDKIVDAEGGVTKFTTRQSDGGTHCRRGCLVGKYQR